jgi:hypothetical protein
VDYFHTKLNQLRKLKWHISEQDEINIIVHNINDSGTRQMALANNPRTLYDLLTYFRSCDQNPPSDANSESRPQTFKIRCFSCHAVGHRSINCPAKRLSNVKPTTSGSNNPICTFCNKNGHYYSLIQEVNVR